MKLKPTHLKRELNVKMKRNQLLLIIFITCGLCACVFQPKAGGPCTYVTAQDFAKITAISTNYIELHNGTNQYQASKSMFKSEPKIGNSYKVQFNEITKGSCTPFVIKSVELITR